MVKIVEALVKAPFVFIGAVLLALASVVGGLAVYLTSETLTLAQSRRTFAVLIAWYVLNAVEDTKEK